MAKKITLELTEAQLIAIINITDEASAMIGVGGADHGDELHRVKWVKLIDRMLKNNGYKRIHS